MTGRPEVFGLIDFDRDGAAAEYVTLPASELAARPRSVSQAQTATLPLAALAAWQALTDYTAVEPGERVLVYGGSGGVGVFAVQLAAYLGGHVTATGRGANDGFACSLGAETFVSTADGGLEGEISGVDVVVGTVGGAVLSARSSRCATAAAPSRAVRAHGLRARRCWPSADSRAFAAAYNRVQCITW